MPNLPNPGGTAPVCPICEGPCTHDFERGEYVFPDRLPHADGEPEPTPPRAAKRARRLAEDRAHWPAEDRSGEDRSA